MISDGRAAKPGARLRRVIVGLDTNAESEMSIAEASVVAELTEAELVGVFVEETAVAQAMAIGPVRLVGAAAPGLRDVDPPSWRRSQRALITLRRREVSRWAEGRKLRWSFEVREGSLSRVVLGSAHELDVVVVGHARHRRTTTGGGVVALLSSDVGARPVLELARALATHAQAPLHVVIADGEGADEAAEALGGGLVNRLHRDDRTPRRIAAALRRLRARLVVASGHPDAMDPEIFETLRAGLSCPLVLVR